MQRNSSEVKHKNRKTSERVMKTFESKNDAKASRAKFKCPEKLKVLIELVKLLPLNEVLPPLRIEASETAINGEYQSFATWARETLEMFGDDAANSRTDWTKDARAVLHNQIKHLPADFQQYVWRDCAPESRFIVSNVIAGSNADFVVEPNDVLNELWKQTNETVERYQNFKRLHDKFRRAVGFAKNLSEQRQDFAGFRPAPLLGETQFEIDANGFVRVQPDNFSQAMMQDVNLHRIRACEVCGRVFWAERNDAQACSPNHADRRRKRLSRQNNKARREIDKNAINERQRENRARNKRLKALKEGK